MDTKAGAEFCHRNKRTVALKQRELHCFHTPCSTQCKAVGVDVPFCCNVTHVTHLSVRIL